MPLGRGIWSINANGQVGQLQITEVDDQGNLSGTVFGEQIEGFWDENSQKITFISIHVPQFQFPGFRNTVLIYTGYQFSGSIERGSGPPYILGVRSYTLTGYFEALPVGGAAAPQRLLYGWVAHIDMPQPQELPHFDALEELPHASR
jgi:hypothetical protein